MALVTCYDPMPIRFTRGEGVWLYDEQGTAYLDSFSGIAVCGLGHAHPDITHTLQQQAAKLVHCSNAFVIKEQELLAARLTEMAGMNQVFFCNSGAEANEAAIKLTRLFGHQKDIGTPSIIVMERSFHGRTMATLTASGTRKVQAGFEPLVPGFIRAPFNDLEAVHKIAANREDVVAVMLETIQGEGGVYAAEEGYLRALAQFCEQQDWMLILDEVQTGNGRTGKLYSCMHYAIQPDVLTTAKGLGNGFPIGACLMSKRALDLFKPGNQGSTFGGNPLACAVALKVLEVIERDKLCEKVSKNSAFLMDQLIEHLGEHPRVKAIRGKGYMIGIELDRPAKDIKKLGLEYQVLINVTAETVIRLLPPLIISEEEIEELVSRLKRTIQRWEKE